MVFAFRIALPVGTINFFSSFLYLNSTMFYGTDPSRVSAFLVVSADFYPYFPRDPLSTLLPVKIAFNAHPTVTIFFSQVAYRTGPS